MKQILTRLVEVAINKSRILLLLVVSMTLAMAALIVVGSLSSTASNYLPSLQVDADPENMLEWDDPDRILNRKLKEEFSLYDMIVVGVSNTLHSEGVFNTASLGNIYELTEFAKSIQWKDLAGNAHGVIAPDLISLSTIDNVSSGGSHTVSFEWLMPSPPQSAEEVQAVKEKVRRLPLFNGTLLSNDKKSIALYIPITSKQISYQVTKLLKQKISTFQGSDQFFITGLPVAQDTFAAEMFKQMAVTAPAAMGLIFILLYLFFRNLKLVIAPLIVSVICIVLTMGLLILMGFKIHIMSSMVPIFIMPIAVLDSVHILSEFYDRYPSIRDRRTTIQLVMAELTTPMFYTSLTTTIGFISLNLTPLPPLRIFGTFVGLGVLLAWLMTIVCIPSYIMLMPEKSFENFGRRSCSDQGRSRSLLGRMLDSMGKTALRFSRLILIAVTLLFIVAGYGISKIVANDNPVKWFEATHEIRKSDKAINQMFGGSYMAYLMLADGRKPLSYMAWVRQVKEGLSEADLRPLARLSKEIDSLALLATNQDELTSVLIEHLEGQLPFISDDEFEVYEASLAYLEHLDVKGDLFKTPEVLSYMHDLQDFLNKSEYVGKSSSIVEIVKTVRRELYGGTQDAYQIPETADQIAQTLITFESSHRPQDLWHFITPDYKAASIWLQLKNGDNVNMKKVVQLVDRFFQMNPPPIDLTHQWFGLNHLNVVWQDKIVLGMMKALLGSFVVVLMIMTFLYRSLLWGFLAMVPLLFSVAVLYGFVGLGNIDYDAPIAILSALILGLAVDYAIHFITRGRQIYAKEANWESTIKVLFREPARAITRNAIIIGVGFLPLLFSNLVPYKTTGIFISSILLFAGIATLLILPALLYIFENKLIIKRNWL